MYKKTNVVKETQQKQSEDYGLPYRAIPKRTKGSTSKNSLKATEVENYVLGIRNEKTWIGEEVIYLKANQPFNYSAVSITPVKVIKIGRSCMMSKMHPDYLQHLLDLSQ